MENWRRYIPILLALVFAGLSSASMYHYLHTRERVSTATPDLTIPVVVATRDLAPGMRLAAEDLSVQDWPTEIGSGHYFHTPRELIGRTLRTSLLADEPLTLSKLLQEGENFASLIPPDMRGVTVRVRKSEALAKFLERGSVVDVIALIEEDRAAPAPKVIAQAVRILAVHDRGDLLKHDQASKQMEVTLMVTPRDAGWIVMAMNRGTIELVLRNDRTPAGFQWEASVEP